MRQQRGRLHPPVVFLTIFLAALTGCAGPSTSVLPSEETVPFEIPEDSAPVLEEPNPFYLQESLDYLSRAPRVCGSVEEAEAADYIGQLFRDYGYEVKLQRFVPGEQPGGPGVTGTNVTAVLKAPSPEADILIITAHHDTTEASPGANESASGVVAMLESARLLSRLPSDTELRFVSFSGDEAGWAGARFYLQELSPEEKRRVIGEISLDALGYVEDNSVTVGTMDGKETLVGNLLREASEDLPYGSWMYVRKTAGDHSLFVGQQIPAVTVGQRIKAYESKTPQDRAGVVNTEELAETVEVITRAAAGLMSGDTPSQIAKSRYINDLRDGAFVQAKDMPFYFGQDSRQTELSYGITGELISTNTDGAGVVVDNYRFRMKWFDVDQVILTDYHYSNGKLDTISLDADGAGISFEDMRERIGSWYGQPVGTNEGPEGTEYDWTDPVYRKFIALIPEAGGYTAEIREYPEEETVLGVFLPDKTAVAQTGADGVTETVEPDIREAKLLDLIGKIIPAADQDKIDYIRIYTDGVGGRTGYLDPARKDTEEDGKIKQFTISMDLEDLFTRDGQWRSKTAAVKMLLGFYGQILEANGADTYMAAFSQQFSERADTDFSNAFTMFVLCQRPEPVSDPSDEQILFFYGQEGFTGVRDQIRSNLKFQDGKQQEALSPEP